MREVAVLKQSDDSRQLQQANLEQVDLVNQQLQGENANLRQQLSKETARLTQEKAQLEHSLAATIEKIEEQTNTIEVERSEFLQELEAVRRTYENLTPSVSSPTVPTISPMTGTVSTTAPTMTSPPIVVQGVAVAPVRRGAPGAGSAVLRSPSNNTITVNRMPMTTSVSGGSATAQIRRSSPNSRPVSSVSYQPVLQQQFQEDGSARLSAVPAPQVTTIGPTASMRSMPQPVVGPSRSGGLGASTSYTPITSPEGYVRAGPSVGPTVSLSFGDPTLHPIGTPSSKSTTHRVQAGLNESFHNAPGLNPVSGTGLDAVRFGAQGTQRMPGRAAGA